MYMILYVVCRGGLGTDPETDLAKNPESSVTGVYRTEEEAIASVYRTEDRGGSIYVCQIADSSIAALKNLGANAAISFHDVGGWPEEDAAVPITVRDANKAIDSRLTKLVRAAVGI